MDRTAQRPVAAIAVATFVVLVLELAVTRLFAYVGSTHATSTALSIALLGLGVGAALGLRFPRWSPAPALAAALLALAGAEVGGIGLEGLVAVALAPFACAGALISAAYAARGGAAARTTYAIDLGAAAIGCLVAPRLLGVLAPAEIIAALGIVTCALCARRWWVVAVVHAAVLALGIAGRLPDGPLAVVMASGAGSEKAIVEAGTSVRDVVDSAWSPLGRLDVRRIPGDGDRLGVFTDGMSPTYLVSASGAFESTWGLLMSLPYRALHPARVLVLGSGAGASVWLAKKYGSSRVDAVEVNPAIPDLLSRWRAFGGDVYRQPGVRLATADARRFLTDSTDRYDAIELALALTGNAQGQPAGLEAHLYTVEAVALYLSRLTEDGALVLIHSDPGNAYRQLLTVLAALEARGIDRARALEGIVVLHDPRPGTAYRYLIVVRTRPMPPALVDGFDVAPAELLWGPGDPPARAAQLLDPARIGATAKDDFAPVHDDRPYFFQNTRGVVATALAQPGRLWVLAGALVLAGILMIERRDLERGAEAGFARPAMVAIALGAAYLCVELALIQRITVAAGGTLYAVSFVLFGLLAWSAVGALVLGGRWRRLERGVTAACLVAGAAIAATALLVRDLAWLDAIASDALRLAMIVLLLAPAGLAIGGPFPVLLAHHGEPAGRIARLWAVNGAAAVAGGIAGVLALRTGGTTHALLLAAGLYAVAAAIAPGNHRR